MRRKKPQPKPKKLSAKKTKVVDFLKSKTILIGITSVVGFLGGVWTLDQHWLPREIHNISLAQTRQELAQTNQSVNALSKEMALSSARNEAFYWLRRENELKTLCTRSPKDPQLRQDLEQTIIERRRAEDEVRRLQEKK